MSDHTLDRLFATIAARRDGPGGASHSFYLVGKRSDARTSYTAQLLAAGVEKCAKKFGEEAVEAVIAGVARDPHALAAESADVLYHLLVLWAAVGITPDNVYAVLKEREGQSGLAEKASRPKSKL